MSAREESDGSASPAPGIALSAVSLESGDGSRERLESITLEGGGELDARGKARRDSTELVGTPTDNEDVPPAALKSSMSFASYNFVNSIIGAGIIGLPFALREAGFFAGIALLCGLAGATDYSVRMLVRLAGQTRQSNYEHLARHVFGKFGYFSISVAMFLFAYGAMLAYLIIIGDTVSLVVGNWNGEEVTLWARRLTIFTVAVLMVLPLSLVKNMSRLANSSFVSLVAVAWIVFVVVVRSMTGVTHAPLPSNETERELRPVGRNFFPAIGIVAFAFVCQHSCFIVYHSLENNTEVRYRRLTHTSIAVSLTACLMLACTGYLTFRNITEGNLLNNYAHDDQLMNVTRLLYSLTMVLTYPMEIFVARHTMHAVVFYGKGPMTDRRHYTISIFLWGSSVLIAMVVSDLGLVLELTGGVSATYIGFILPGLISLSLSEYRWLPWQNTGRVWQSLRDQAPAYGLLVFGVISFISSTILTLVNAASGEEAAEEGAADREAQRTGTL